VKRKKQRSTRDRKIAALRARGLTLEAIGKQFGLTRERVRQITDQYPMARRFTTLPELLARFGVQEHAIMKAIAAAGLNPQTLRQGKRFIFFDADVKRIVRHLKLWVTQECPICGKSFTVRGFTQKRLCSPACLPEHRRRLRTFTPGEDRPMSETTRQIYDLLSAEPPGTTWVGYTEALRLTGLTTNQLLWLRRRGIIASRPSGQCSNFGSPCFLYSARHCELLGRFVIGQKQRSD
jgi:Sigma-70, region 4